MKEHKTIVIGLSGGVDSAVAALLLKRQGFNVIGAFMKNFSDTKDSLTGECSWIKEKRMAQKIAAKLNIEFVIFDFEKEYKKYVIKPMFKDYSAGLTPNPDALCNKIIKFPLFWKKAKALGADYIAMGHYIKSNNKKGKYFLEMPKDKKKDQSYFLYDLTQKDLEHTLFPIGSYTKEEVRQIAKKNNFPNYDKKGTSGICFVGKIDMISFLKNKIKPKQGIIKSPEGNIVGNHNGIMYYTIGQRAPNNSEFKINREYRNKIKDKIYVINKNAKSNILIVGPINHPSSLKKQFRIIKTNWINPINYPLKNIKVRIRHLGNLYPAEIKKEKAKIIVLLKKPLSSVSPGQSCVVYKNKQILGGGEIR